MPVHRPAARARRRENRPARGSPPAAAAPPHPPADPRYRWAAGQAHQSPQGGGLSRRHRRRDTRASLPAADRNCHGHLRVPLTASLYPSMHAHYRAGAKVTTQGPVSRQDRPRTGCRRSRPGGPRQIGGPRDLGPRGPRGQAENLSRALAAALCGLFRETRSQRQTYEPPLPVPMSGRRHGRYPPPFSPRADVHGDGHVVGDPAGFRCSD